MSSVGPLRTGTSGRSSAVDARAMWAVLLLLLTYMSSYIDRSVLGILQEPIKRELLLTDGQLGILSGPSFALLYALLGVPIARLSERYNRGTVIALCLVVWSGMTALCGLASSYLQLLLFRVGVGVGEAGGTPASHSLITDYFPPKQRASALAVYSLGVPLGAFLGAFLGGLLGQSFGWRSAFFVVGPIGFVLALLVKFTMGEPARGQSENHAAPQDGRAPPFLAVVRLLVSQKKFVHLAIGAALTVTAGVSILVFMAPFYLRNFHLPLSQVGLISGLINGLAAGAGIVIGGFVPDWIGRSAPRAYAWIPALCLAIAGPLFALSFLASFWQESALLMFVATIGMYTYFAPTFAVMHNMVEPRMRATAAAFLYLIINLIGMGLGPPLVGIASDFFARRAYAGDFNACHAVLSKLATPSCQAATAEGLKYALAACSFLLVWAAMHFLIAGFKIGRAPDELRG